ncbi:agamous-like MADS-box protein AGL19 isoform X2 [Arachis hypogaea]|uniref:agamous-like MADS-box protein AGL19 isoform X2 n=1 Tax=Arachis hypogaea TaxID=3818 RepID=UPI000A2C1241
MKCIKNETSRQVTFSKRRNGLLKKTFKLSVLCDAEVALIIFSTRGKLYEFSSSSVNKIVERYQRKVKDLHSLNTKQIQENTQVKEGDDINITKKLEQLEVSKRKLLGDGLDSCPIEELQQIENQLERSLTKVRARKNQLFREQIETLKEQEKCLLEENRKLKEKECHKRAEYEDMFAAQHFKAPL